jgi:RNA polymerase sigma-70 factor (ECF subfamily)
MDSKTRETLLESLREGTDPLAWDEFFELYWPLIYSYARRRGCSEHTAEEIVQDVMLRVFEQQDVYQYDPKRGRFRDWLKTLARNKLAEHRRRPAQRVRGRGGDSDPEVTEPEADTAAPDVAWQDAFERTLLMALLDVVRQEMNPRRFQAFELFVLCDLPGAKVARITGLSRSAVYQAHRTVLKRLEELGQPYRKQGQLNQRIREALESCPEAAVERSLADHIEKTMRQRQECSSSA